MSWQTTSLLIAVMYASVCGQISMEDYLCDRPNKGQACDTQLGSNPCCDDLLPYYYYRQRRAMPDTLITMISHQQAVITQNAYLSEGSIATPPVFVSQLLNPPAPQVLAVALQIFRISDIDQKAQTFKMHYGMFSSWRDCRTMQNCTWLELTEAHPHFTRFWTPNWFIEERVGQDTSLTSKALNIDPDGFVVLKSTHAASFKCKYDFAEFPFDTQDCKITIKLPMFQSHQLFLSWEPQPPHGGGVQLNEQKGAEWIISKGAQESGTIVQDISSVFGYNVSFIRANLRFKRRPNRQIINIVIPSFFYWFSSWVGLWIDCSSTPARAAMGVIPVLIMSNKMNQVSTSLPPSASMNRIERFMFSILVILCVHLFEFGLVNFGMRREKERKELLKAAKSDEENAARESAAKMDVESSPSSSSRGQSRILRDRGVRTWSMMCHRIDVFAMRYLNRSLNMHVRWASAVAVVVVSWVTL